jgi:hypothetical protein
VAEKLQTRSFVRQQNEHTRFHDCASGASVSADRHGLVVCARLIARQTIWERRSPKSWIQAIGLACALGCSPSEAQEQNVTTIHGHYSEVHYWMEGDRPPIVWNWDFTLQLSGKNTVREEWSGHNQRNLQRARNRESALGETTGAVSWRVLGPNRLQKTINFRQHTMRLTIATNNKDCQLDVEFRLKPGFSDIYVQRADNGEWAHFSLPKTREASCTIN